MIGWGHVGRGTTDVRGRCLAPQRDDAAFGIVVRRASMGDDEQRGQQQQQRCGRKLSLRPEPCQRHSLDGSQRTAGCQQMVKPVSSRVVAQFRLFLVRCAFTNPSPNSGDPDDAALSPEFDVRCAGLPSHYDKILRRLKVVELFP